jgi:ABC-type multidrug transport system ATPase subunit
MTGSSAYVDVRNLSITYSPASSKLRAFFGHAPIENKVIHSLNLQLSHSDRVVLFGSGGSGKSTLLRALAGAVSPSFGRILINGLKPSQNRRAAAGYVSSEESEPLNDSIRDILFAYGRSHDVLNLTERLDEVTDAAGLDNLLEQPAKRLSTTERLRLNLARAALSDAPLILLDGVADELSPDFIQNFIETAIPHQTVILATRFTKTAELFDWPILLLHDGHLAHTGTREELADVASCPRIMDVWVEGLRYDLLRRLKQHPGIVSVRLVPTTQFSGQKLRLALRSSRYLPSIYDAISQAPLVSVQEVPVSLDDILKRI